MPTLETAAELPRRACPNAPKLLAAPRNGPSAEGRFWVHAQSPGLGVQPSTRRTFALRFARRFCYTKVYQGSLWRLPLPSFQPGLGLPCDPECQLAGPADAVPWAAALWHALRSGSFGCLGRSTKPRAKRYAKRQLLGLRSIQQKRLPRPTAGAEMLGWEVGQSTRDHHGLVCWPAVASLQRGLESLLPEGQQCGRDSSPRPSAVGTRGGSWHAPRSAPLLAARC